MRLTDITSLEIDNNIEDVLRLKMEELAKRRKSSESIISKVAKRIHEQNIDMNYLYNEYDIGSVTELLNLMTCDEALQLLGQNDEINKIISDINTFERILAVSEIDLSSRTNSFLFTRVYERIMPDRYTTYITKDKSDCCLVLDLDTGDYFNAYGYFIDEKKSNWCEPICIESIDKFEHEVCSRFNINSNEYHEETERIVDEIIDELEKVISKNRETGIDKVVRHKRLSVKQV